MYTILPVISYDVKFCNVYECEKYDVSGEWRQVYAEEFLIFSYNWKKNILL